MRTEKSTMTSLLNNYTCCDRFEAIDFKPRFGYMNIVIDEQHVRLAFRFCETRTCCSQRKMVWCLEYGFALEQPGYKTLVLADDDLWQYSTNDPQDKIYQAVYPQKLDGCVHAWKDDSVIIWKTGGLRITGQTRVVHVQIDKDADSATLEKCILDLFEESKKWTMCVSCSILTARNVWDPEREEILSLHIAHKDRGCKRCKFKQSSSCTALVLFQGPVSKYTFLTAPHYHNDRQFERIGW